MQEYLCKDLLFLAECVLISPHIAALCQAMQAYPPLDPNWNGYWLVHRKLQPWQPAVWQILWWRRSREENWTCRCLFPDSQTDRHRHLCGVYTVGDSMVKILKTDDLSCSAFSTKPSIPPLMFQTNPLRTEPPTALLPSSSVSVFVFACSSFCREAVKGESWGVGLSQEVMVKAWGGVWLCSHVHDESLLNCL